MRVFLKGFVRFFLIYLGFSVFEMTLQAVFKLRYIPATFEYSVFDSLVQSWGQYLAFILQFGLSLAILSVACEMIFHLLQHQRRWPISLFTIVCSFLLNTYQIPQLYFSQISMTWIQIVHSAFFAVLGLGLILACYQFTKIALARSALIQRVLIASASVSVLCFLIPKLLNVFQFESAMEIPEKSVLVLSIDSMRPDYVTEYVKENPQSRFARVISESVQFSNIITPLGRTQPSLSSFLTEQYPTEHGLRDNLYSNFLSTDELYKNKGLVKYFKDRNYQIAGVFDETKFASFSAGQVFDRIYAPPHTVLNHILPFLFTSSLYWSYFSNSFGHLLFPSIEDNASFSYAYDPAHFFTRLKTALAQSNQQQPFFVLAHTCAIHYPGYSQYPYYQKFQTGNETILTGYPDYRFQGTSRTVDETQSLRKLAKGQFHRLIDEGVEPFLRLLESSSKFQNLTLIIMSDHGESFWQPGFRYQKGSMPTHGLPALFDDDSYRTFFAIHASSLQPQTVPWLTSLIDAGAIIRTALEPKTAVPFADRLPKPAYRYYESGIWPKAIFNSQLVMHDRSVDKVYALQGDKLHVNPAFEDNLIMQKSRSVFSQDRHWTLMPTIYGLEGVVCDYPKCRSFRPQEAKETEKALRYMDSVLKVDIENGLWPKGQIQALADGRIYWQNPDLEKASFALKWLMTVHNLNVMGDFESYLQFSKDLMRSSKADAWIKARIAMDFFVFCNRANTNPGCRWYLKWQDEQMDQELLKMMTDFRFFFTTAQETIEILRDGPIKTRLQQTLEKSPFFPTPEVEWNNKVRKAFADKNQKALRSLVQGLNLYPQYSFYLRFLGALKKESCLSLADCRAELAGVKARFADELGSGFFEVNMAWINFVYYYSKVTFPEIYEGELFKMLSAGGLPFLATVNSIQYYIRGNASCKFPEKWLQTFQEKSKWQHRPDWSQALFQRAFALAGCK